MYVLIFTYSCETWTLNQARKQITSGRNEVSKKSGKSNKKRQTKK